MSREIPKSVSTCQISTTLLYSSDGKLSLAVNGEIQLAAHRWYDLEGAVLEQQLLLDSKGLVST